MTESLWCPPETITTLLIVYSPIWRHPWWLRQSRIHLQCRRPGLDSWVRKIPWRRECSIPAWRIPWTEEFGGLQSMGSLWAVVKAGKCTALNVHIQKYTWKTNEFSIQVKMLERLLLKLKLQCLATWWEKLTHWERLWCWERLKAKREGGSRGWDVEWHHWLNGHKFEQTAGDSEGQGSLVCYSPRGHKESDMTQWLNNNKKMLGKTKKGRCKEYEIYPNMVKIGRSIKGT